MSSTDGGEAATAAGRAQSRLERLLSRNLLISGVALLTAIALAWAWLLQPEMAAMPMHGHHGMAADPWSASYLVPAFTMWTVMMMAMMLPSAAPMILLHARIDREKAPGKRLVNNLLFAATYLAVWTGFSLAAALAQALLIQVGLVSAATLALGDRGVAAAVLAVAALYQFSPAKKACLDQCRSPIHFIMRFHAPGTKGAIRLGLAHGLYCVGCCWGLMLLLFVAGVMNLAWVAVLAALVFVEKAAPAGWRVNVVIGIALFAGAAVLVIA